jgi:cytochrome c oxidase subunit II
MNKSQKILAITGIAVVIVAFSIWYGSHNGLLPATASGEAELYDRLFNQLIAIATGSFLLIQGLIIYSMFKFRQRPGDNADGPHIADNAVLELAWTAVPTMVVLWVGITSFDVYNVMHYQEGDSAMMAMAGHNHVMPHKMPQIPSLIPAANAATLDDGNPTINPKEGNTPAPADPNETVVEVVGMRYAWIFTYPGTEVVSAELHLPVGRKVRLKLSANDVIHAFWVPQLRMKQDTVPGQNTEMEFTPNKIGEYPIVCAELCGSQHGGMRAQMFVETPEAYAAWIEENQETASVVDDKAIAQLDLQAI